MLRKPALHSFTTTVPPDIALVYPLYRFTNFFLLSILSVDINSIFARKYFAFTQLAKFSYSLEDHLSVWKMHGLHSMFSRRFNSESCSGFACAPPYTNLPALFILQTIVINLLLCFWLLSSHVHAFVFE